MSEGILTTERDVASRPRASIVSPRHAVLAALLIAALALPQFLGAYGQFIYATVLIYFLISLSLNILTGFAGQISLGHAGFWALGAYASAILVNHFNAPFLIGIFAGAATGAVFGALVAVPALRVQGHYLAIATLSFALLVQQVLFEWDSVTGGHQGLSVPRPEIFGYELSEDRSYIYLLLAVAIFAAWMTGNLRRSHTGRGMLALKASSVAAQTAGIGRARHVIIAFTLSGALTGLSGALYAHLIGFISSDTFSLGLSIAFLSMAVIGGLNSNAGALLGAAYLTIAPVVFREFKDAQMIVYGIALILCMRYLPGGLASLPTVIRRITARKR